MKSCIGGVEGGEENTKRVNTRRREVSELLIVSVSFPVSAAKYLDKSNLREKMFQSRVWCQNPS